jgi:hypothetical protein
MKGSGSRRRLRPAALADCRPRTQPGASWPLSRRPPAAFNLVHQSLHKKTADSVHRSAATASGMPHEPHERDTVILTRPRLLGSCAYRMARYKVIRQREDRTKCPRCPSTSETRSAGDERCHRVVKIPDTGRSERPLLSRYSWSLAATDRLPRDSVVERCAAARRTRGNRAGRSRAGG